MNEEIRRIQSINMTKQSITQSINQIESNRIN